MERLVEEAKEHFGVRLTPAQIDAYRIYLNELTEWNQQHNLTAIQEPEQVRLKHFLDSLSLGIALRNTRPERVVDVGSGAGFPGLALKIAFPQLKVSLIESVGKKLDFCAHIVERLNLTDVTLFKLRAEEAGQLRDQRERYDLAVARAVAVMPVLMEYLLPLVRVGGMAVAMKGESAPAETQTATHAIRLLGGELRQIVPVQLPGVADQRYLVLVDKVSATPPGYPRRVGLPAKRPIPNPSVR